MKEEKYRKFGTIILIIGIVFLLIGCFIQIPTHEISYRGMEEYVGGDAYNYMIEASIRSGEIAGNFIVKAIFIVFGVSLILLAIFIQLKYGETKKQNKEGEQPSTTNDNDSLEKATK